jgi:hypothetical protein
MKTYHVGVYFKYPKKRTVVMQLRESIDSLSCETTEYFGEVLTTKAKFKSSKNTLLDWLKTDKQFNNKFNNVESILID